MPSSPMGTVLSPPRHVFAFGLIGASLLLAGPASGDYEEYLVNDETSGEESRIDPVAVRLDDDGYLALWADNARGHTDVYARRFDSTFSPLAEPYRVNTDEGLFSHRAIAVSTPGGGRFIVAWEDERTGESDRSIYGRLFDSGSGDPLGEDFRIDDDLGFGSDLGPRAHTSPDGESLVVWTGRVNQRSRVIGRRVSPDGSLGGDFLVAPENPTLEQEDPSVTRTPDGRWVVAWAEQAEPSDWNIYYRFLSADGTPQGAPVRANSDLLFEARQAEPDIALVGSRLLLVWSDLRTVTADVWGRWIQFDGTFDGPDTSLREDPDDAADQRPRIRPGPNGTFALSWFGGIADRQRAMAQYHDSDGTLLADARIIDDPVFGVFQRDPFVVPAGDGAWWELWSDDRQDFWDVYAHRYEPATGSSGAEKVLRTNPGSASQMYADVGIFPDGGSVVAWADFRDGSLAIYGRLLDAFGAPEGTSFRVGSVPINADLTTLDAHDAVADYAPRVAAGPSGFVVTWPINQLGERLNYWAQYFERDGTRIGENFLVAPGDQQRPQRQASPIMLPNGGFAIAYQMASTRGDGSDPDIFLQRYAEDGLPIEPRIVVPEGVLAAEQVSPAIAVNSTGTIYVSWIDRRFGGWDVMAQRFSETGERLGGNVSQHPPDEPSSDQVNADVAIGSDRTVSVWETRPATLGRIEGRLEIFATAAATGSADGPGAEATAAGSIEVLFTANRGREVRGIKQPRVEMAPNGRFLVTWWENADGQTQLLAQRYDAAGMEIGTPYPIHGNDVEGSRLPAEVAVEGERIQYVWSETRRAKGWDVRARLVDWEFSGAPTPVLLRLAEGVSEPGGVDLRWETAMELGFRGFHVHRQFGGEEPSRGLLPGSRQLTSSLIPSTSNGLYRYFDTSAPTRSRIEYFLEAVDTDGRTELFGPVIVNTGDALSAAAWPNPFRDQVQLGRTHGDPIDVDLYDATGRLVRTLLPASSEDPLVWDGRAADGDQVPTGVYFARPRQGGETIRLIRIR